MSWWVAKKSLVPMGKRIKYSRTRPLQSIDKERGALVRLRGRVTADKLAFALYFSLSCSARVPLA